MDFKEVLKKAAKDHLDLKAFIDALIDDGLEKALDKLVKGSSTPYDDMFKSALYPLLEAELKKLYHEEIDDLLK